MRKALPFLLIILLLCSCSSGGGGGQTLRQQDIADHYGAIEEMTVRALIRTEFPDRVVDFSVEYIYRKDSDGHMTVLAPEAIAGIEAEVSPDGVTLTYDGLSLEVGKLPGTGLSPMESLPYMIGQWSGKYCTGTGVEKLGTRELLCARYKRTTGDTTVEQTALFDPETLEPVRCELYINGALTVTAEFEEQPAG